MLKYFIFTFESKSDYPQNYTLDLKKMFTAGLGVE